MPFAPENITLFGDERSHLEPLVKIPQQLVCRPLIHRLHNKLYSSSKHSLHVYRSAANHLYEIRQTKGEREEECVLCKVTCDLIQEGNSDCRTWKEDHQEETHQYE